MKRAKSACYREVVAKVNRLMEKEAFLERGYHMEDMARDCTTNRSYISQAVKEDGGGNFNAFLNRKRVLKSRSYLRKRSENGEFSYTVADVAELCGFASERTFYRAYRKVFGTTPNRHRRHEEI